MKEMVGGCCVCSDERGWPENPLVYCDGANCNVAVHQACYGIVTVPTGPWYCRKCESQERSARVRCELCPSRTGALKKTNTSSGWAHVVCALYIPEVRFGNVTTMEPINLDSIPIERYGKTCYICQEMNKGSKAQVGACMQCNKSGCRQQFHVTCAQQLGLLCEEAGNYLDNVKYCGYCQHHYSKLKKGGNVKLIPPYKPITYETGSSDGPSSPEKESDAGATTSSLAQTTTTTASMLSSAAPMATQSTSSAPVPISTSASSSQAQVQKGSASSGSSLGMSQGGAGTSSLSSASSGQQSNVPSTANSQSSGTGSSSSSNSKQRKSSSASKSSNSSSSSSQNATPTTNTNASQSSNSGSTKSSANVSSSSSSNSTSGKDFKDKHSKAMGKVSSSKEKDSFRDKSSKSNSNSSSNSSSKNSKDNSLSSSGGASSNQDSQKGDPKSEKSSSTSSSSLPKSIPGGSILAPSVLQSTATVKETMGKFSTANFTDNSTSQDNATSFGNEISAKNTANNSGPVSKKRKASDNNSKQLQQQQQQQLQDDKSMMKDVSVTLIPLRSYEKGNNDQGDVKKVKTEGGSPLQLSEPNLQNVSPNLLATQTGATSISITKQPMSSSSSSTSSNVIIKPPIIKDLGALHSASSPSTTSPVTTPSLVVSVPLSTASGAAGLNLNPTSNANLSSASSTTVGQNLFQQAIQNRTEHLNFSNATTRHSNPINRASPVITVSNSTQQQQQQQQSHHQSMADHQLHQIHHRQSPLVMQQQQSNALVVDNGSRASLSPTVSGHSQLMASGNLATIQQSDSGMLKITYEKQQSAIVTPPSSHRLSAIQDDIAPGRRSSQTFGVFQAALKSPPFNAMDVQSAVPPALASGHHPQSQPHQLPQPWADSLKAHRTNSMSFSHQNSSTSTSTMNNSISNTVSGGGGSGGGVGGFLDSGSKSHPFQHQHLHHHHQQHHHHLPAENLPANCSSSNNNSNTHGSLFNSSVVCNKSKVGGSGGSSSNNSSSISNNNNSTAPSAVSSACGAAASSMNPFSANTYKFKSGLAHRQSPVTTTSAITSLVTSSGAPSTALLTNTRSRTPDSSYSTFGSVGSAASGGGGGGGGGGLKFSYEAQSGPGAVTTASTLLTPSPSPSMCQLGATPIATNTIGAQPIVKDSPPSSPNSEAGSSRKRTRKQEAISSKDMKIFQNGIHASHMLGNQLNPSSSVAQKMSDQLHMELEAHSVYTVPTDNGPQLIGPPFPGKQNQSNNAIKSAPQGPPSLSSMLSGSATATAAGGAPQSLEQLLERQWEQGSQFLMEQAQHFDIASLLSCLHQLRTENIRLEDHVNSLVARRDHLLAVNARLAIPLNPPTNSVNQGQFSSGSGQPVVNGPVESSNVIQGGGSSSGGRGSGGRSSSSNVAASIQHSFNVPLENGIDFRHSMAQQQSQAALHASQHSQQLEQSRSGGGSGVRSGSGSYQNSVVSGGGGVVVGGGLTLSSGVVGSSVGVVNSGGGVSGSNASGGRAVNSSSSGGGRSAVSGGIHYSPQFQQIRRDDAQVKPS